MVIDLKLFTPGQLLVPGLLTVVEQIPGLVVYADQTNILELGYWPRQAQSVFMILLLSSSYTQLQRCILPDHLRAERMFEAYWLLLILFHVMYVKILPLLRSTAIRTRTSLHRAPRLVHIRCLLLDIHMTKPDLPSRQWHCG